ncbi:tRNA pseudouridine(38/39) synthase [Morella rubra]|uniref:tRNA pseudouridine(38/39) synthase n=1 Tax=Morella rubra TaxID=262757 RepID=A0A6A1ULR8_9ROSI|nr:tRNA pseudouridine(38/39) synthase [Morella rubra]
MSRFCASCVLLGSVLVSQLEFALSVACSSGIFWVFFALVFFVLLQYVVVVIDTLLDTGRTPRKPQYAMAPELPLVLRSCEFEDLKFICSADAGEALHVHLANQCRSYQLQATIFQEALLSQLPISRASYEERRVKLNSKTPRVSKSS